MFKPKKVELKSNATLSPEESKVMELIVDNPLITKKELSVKMSKSIPTISRIIKALTDKGIIEGKTSNKSGEWIISPKKD